MRKGQASVNRANWLSAQANLRDARGPLGYNKYSLATLADASEHVDVLKIEARQEAARRRNKKKPVTLPRFSFEK